VTDSVKIDNKAMFFSDKWHYDDPDFKDYQSYDATGKMIYRYSTIADSYKRKSSIFRETD